MLARRAIQATPSGACAAPTPDIEPPKGRDWSITAAIRVRGAAIAPPPATPTQRNIDRRAVRAPPSRTGRVRYARGTKPATPSRQGHRARAR